MLRIRVVYLIHAHAVFAEDGWVGVDANQVLTSHVHFSQRGIDVSLAANFRERWSELELRVKTDSVAQGVRTKHVIRVDQRALPLQDLTFIECDIRKLLMVKNGVGIDILIRVLLVTGHSLLSAQRYPVINVFGSLALELPINRRQLLDVVKSHTVVVPFGVFALVIADSLNRAALTKALTNAHVRNILKHTLDGLLIGIVSWHSVAICWRYLMVSFLSCPLWRAIDVVPIICLTNLQIYNYMICLIHEREINFGEVRIQRIRHLDFQIFLLLLKNVNRGCYLLRLFIQMIMGLLRLKVFFLLFV